MHLQNKIRLPVEINIKPDKDRDGHLKGRCGGYIVFLGHTRAQMT